MQGLDVVLPWRGGTRLPPPRPPGQLDGVKQWSYVVATCVARVACGVHSFDSGVKQWRQSAEGPLPVQSACAMGSAPGSVPGPVSAGIAVCVPAARVCAERRAGSGAAVSLHVGKRKLLEATRASALRKFWLQQLTEVVGKGSSLCGRDLSILRGVFLGVKAGTLSRWRAGWARWVRFCVDSGLHPASFSPPALASFCDLLLPEDPELCLSCKAADSTSVGGMSSGPRVVRGTLAALAWVGRRCQVSSITLALKDPCVVGFKEQGSRQTVAVLLRGLPICPFVPFCPEHCGSLC
jgi:hypothetical protein